MKTARTIKNGAMAMPLLADIMGNSLRSVREQAAGLTGRVAYAKSLMKEILPPSLKSRRGARLEMWRGRMSLKRLLSRQTGVQRPPSGAYDQKIDAAE
jgi:hypothetical protein